MNLTEPNNASAFFVCVEAMAILGHRWQVLASGDAKSQQKSMRLYGALGEQFLLFESVSANTEKILKDCDVCFFAAEMTPEQKKLIIKHNCVPICPASADFFDFNPIKETGNAFTYQKPSHWHMVDALSRAAYNFQFSYDWKNLKKNLQVMKLVEPVKKVMKKKNVVAV